MYADRKRVRDVIKKARFNEYEAALIERLVEVDGGQEGSLLHDIIVEEVARRLEEAECATLKEA